MKEVKFTANAAENQWLEVMAGRMMPDDSPELLEALELRNIILEINKTAENRIKDEDYIGFLVSPWGQGSYGTGQYNSFSTLKNIRTP